jgi:hypothetical protein
MSEALDIANLVLGIIGTLTGSIAVIIHIWRLRRESPRLETKVLKCEHDFTVSKSQIKTISFWAEFQMKNLGDRGTSVNDISLSFEDDGKKYQLKKRYYRGTFVESERKWINAHHTMDIEADFYDTFEGNDKEQIDCTFTIFHTHGAKNVKAVSQKREEKERG